MKDLSQMTTYQAGVLQASSNRALQKFCDEVLEQYGISKMHWLIIGTIFSAGKNGVRITDLAKQLDTTMSYLTNTINLLESKSILSRKDSEQDNRSRLVIINKNFAGKCKVIERTLRQAMRESIYADIDPTEFRIYMKVMYQLANLKTEPKSSVRKQG